MDAFEFLGLVPTNRETAFELTVHSRLATGHKFLFGGCGLAATIAAAERVTGRDVVWATGQYVSFAHVDDQLTLDVEVIASGHYTSQARIAVRSEDSEILLVSAAFGERKSPFGGQWIEPPAAAPPEESRPRVSTWNVDGSIMGEIDIRLAKGRQWEELDNTPTSDGTAEMWMRIPQLDYSTATLAILGDFVPFGVAQALGHVTMSNSLDNTVRMVHQPARTPTSTDWLLADIHIHGVERGFGHGLVHLWHDDILVATASQSAIVREVPPTVAT